MRSNSKTQQQNYPRHQRTNGTARVYLAGPIAGATYNEARYGWRAEFMKGLAEAGDTHIEVFGPMRGKAHLETVERMAAAYEEHDLNAATVEGILTSPSAIVGRDRFDVERATLVVFNASLVDAPSVGSCIEVGWADSARVPLCLIYRDDDPEHWSNHVMLRELATYACTSVDDAVTLTVGMFRPGL